MICVLYCIKIRRKGYLKRRKRTTIVVACLQPLYTIFFASRRLQYLQPALHWQISSQVSKTSHVVLMNVSKKANFHLSQLGQRHNQFLVILIA